MQKRQTICNKIGCAKLTRSSYCEDHTKASTYDRKRGTPAERGYDPKIWKPLRAALFARDPYCRNCLIKKSTDAAHIRPRKSKEDDTLGNLRGLCHSCHSHETVMMDGGFGRDAVGSRACNMVIIAGAPNTGRRRLAAERWPRHKVFTSFPLDSFEGIVEARHWAQIYRSDIDTVSIAARFGGDVCCILYAPNPALRERLAGAHQAEVITCHFSPEDEVISTPAVKAVSDWWTVSFEPSGVDSGRYGV